MNVKEFALVTNGLGRTGRGVQLRDARDYIKRKLADADDVVVISGFYGEGFIRTILEEAGFKGRGRRLTFVFAGLPEVARAEQVVELRELRQHILNTYHCAVRNVVIRLAIGAKFLHAKLLRFRTQNRLPTYVIGSANFSEAAFAQNNEVMVVIEGRHPGLNEYISHVIETSSPIEELPDDLFAKNWRDFFSNGYLYFRPNRSIAYTIDPFADDEFAPIATRLREQMPKPLPFSERNRLGLNLADLLKLEPPENTRLPFKLPSYAVETDYGYWVPQEYVNFIKDNLEEMAGPRRHALKTRGMELQKAGDGFVSAQIKIYLDEVERRIADGDRPLALKPGQKKTIESKIIRRVGHLKTLLTDAKALERLAQTWVGAPVPEFWDDEASVNRFVEGFCYDIVAKLNTPRRVPRIVTHLADKFGIEEGDDVEKCQDKIKGFFDRGDTWPTDDWPSVADTN